MRHLTHNLENGLYLAGYHAVPAQDLHGSERAGGRQDTWPQGLELPELGSDPVRTGATGKRGRTQSG